MKARRVDDVRAQRRVQSPVGGDDVGATVGVEIAGGHALPQAGQPAEAKRLGHLAECALRVLEHPHRPPLGRQDQLGEPVAVEVAEDRAVHQPKHLAQCAADRLKTTRGVPQQHRGARLRIMPRDRAATDEHVEVAVGIDVRHGDRPRHDAVERLATAGQAAALLECPEARLRAR